MEQTEKTTQNRSVLELKPSVSDQKIHLIPPSITTLSYQFQLPYGSTTWGGNYSDPQYKIDFPLVGSNEQKTTDYCGTFGKSKSKTLGCLNTHDHHPQFLDDRIIHQKQLDGRCLPHLAVIQPRAYHCSDPLCPICCRHWASLETARAIKRFQAFKQTKDPTSKYNLIHVVISVPKHDFTLPFLKLKTKAHTALQMAGLEGGLIIYHPKRYSRKKQLWYFSPHFHSLGVAVAGWIYGDLVSIINAKTSYIIKKLPGKRDKIEDQVKTLMYQLSHAGVPSGHSHAVSWFGSLAYNQLKIPQDLKTKEKELCPQCGSVMRLVTPYFKEFDGSKTVHILDPIFNGTIPHILSSKFEGKNCLVPSVGWRYVEIPIKSGGDCYDSEG